MKTTKLFTFAIIGLLCVTGCESTSSSHSSSGSSTNESTGNKSIDSLPDKFISQAEFISIGLDMDIYDESNNFYGTIEERTFNFTRTFELYDSNNRLVAKAQKEWLSYGTKIDVTGASGEFIGSIEQQVIDSYFSLYSKYKIFDKYHKCVANSDKIDFFTTNVYIDGSDVNVKLYQESFTFTDTWETTINGDIDKRLIIFIPAFISAEQADKEEEEEEEEKRKEK